MIADYGPVFYDALAWELFEMMQAAQYSDGDFESDKVVATFLDIIKRGDVVAFDALAASFRLAVDAMEASGPFNQTMLLAVNYYQEFGEDATAAGLEAYLREHRIKTCERNAAKLLKLIR